ncbi:hypothetical protein L288_09740 [Sphingobium quisquiliarum P25]|uniref:Deacetylase PdaC domain-containing protein n=1 Tax=Sphingobium quisquiliarum P25 TaxID=1329909 RepID=T0H5K1_9SPHN|nr:DUF4163 domain-containing protein [Sphingobium quisquiliarum]EQB07378.1 hypothetical protein L288_09740 [Sphingobium quisquiliarum P25]
MLLTGPLAGAALLLCACSPSSQNEAKGQDGAADVATTNFLNRMAGAEAPRPAPAKPFEQSEKTELLEFLYAWPAQVSAVPDLAAKLRKDMTEGKADALKMAEQDRKGARQSGFPFHAHSLETRWTVTADTPRFLALQSTNYSYTGGAHGMTAYKALLWDKARRRETSFPALMTSEAAFAAAIRDRFCDELDKARAEKRGEPVTRGGDDPFSDCIDPMKEVLTPASKGGKLIEGVTVMISPYSAGPYAEGSYEVFLPVDAAMRKAIKTEYQDAFAAPG